MDFYSSSTRERLRDILAGMKVDRPAAAIAAGQKPLFTVTGGRILLTAIVGEVTSVMDSTATTLQVATNPTVGADTVLSAASASIAAKAVGTKFSLPSAVGTALIISTNQGAVILNANPIWVVSPGTVDLITGTGANAGKAKWTLFYVPLDKGASVTIAE